MAPLEMFPLPQRNTIRTDSYLVRSSSYRTIYRLVVLLIGMQLLTLALLIAAVVR